MILTTEERAALEGEKGPAVALGMEIVTKVGAASGATSLAMIEGGHIDGCLFHGQAGLDFARLLLAGGAQVVVPTTLNVSSLDLLHPDLYRGDTETELSSRALMEAYVEMGCVPTWTCAPYQLPARPQFGQQIAWSESNAIVFANSVLGARTERYGDFMDIACAITGRAPFYGLHTDEGRLATLIIELNVPSHVLDGDIVYPLIGHLVGQVTGTRVPAIVGLDTRSSEDHLKALGAAAASSGAVAMFHAVGVTPEASSLEQATGGRSGIASVTVDLEDLRSAKRELGSTDGPLGAVSVGTPHMSLKELRSLADMVKGLRTRVPFYVNTGRDVLDQAVEEGLQTTLEEFGVTLVTDTCTYITPIMGNVSGAVMTDSGKWAYYAPANLGVDVAFGSLSDCVASAVAGKLSWVAEWS
jgi:predicted aconitase